MRIAVIGTGIAGLGAAHALRRAHEVELFERNAYAGGHTNTVTAERADGSAIALDTGFIVHNHENYPNLERLFRELGVPTQDSEMSFSVSCARCRLEYSGRQLHRQPGVLARPRFLGLLAEIGRFLGTARRSLERSHERSTLAAFVAAERYSRAFADHFLVPLTAAIWSTAPGRALEFPAAYAVRFLDNHSLLGFRRFHWRTVSGGSRRYVQALLAPLGGRVHLGAPVRGLTRDADGVQVHTDDGAAHRFDAAVVATHAPQALALLADPTPQERRVLGAFRTTPNETVLHDDEALLPRRRTARASWNYQVDDCRSPAGQPTMTYYLNRLQALSEPRHYCVTLNRTARIDPERVIQRIAYEHPLYTFESMDAQAELPSLNGVRRTYFCGAYQGYGFHEDGLVSGLRAAAALGARW